MAGVFDRFLAAAKLAVVRAQDEARSLGHPWVGTAHLLLGLLTRMPSVPPERSVRPHSLLAAEAVGVEYEAIRQAVVQALGDHGPGPAGTMRLLTARCEAVVLDAPIVRSSAYPDGYVGTGELLLALLDTELVEMSVPVPEQNTWAVPQRRIPLTAPESYDIGSRLLLDAAGSLDRVRTAVHDVAKKKNPSS